MSIQSLDNLWSFYSFPQLDKIIGSQHQQLLLKGLCGSSDALFLTELFQKSSDPVLVFVENTKKAEQLVAECKSLVAADAADSIALFPSRDAVPYNAKSPFGPTTEARFNVLHRLFMGEKTLIIAPSIVLLQKLPPPKTLFQKLIHLHCNDEISIEDLSRWLVDIGFHRENQISDIGTFSIRGGIVDIYPFLTEHPYRVEFWGNTIDSIRKFDVFTQKSIEYCNKITLFPLHEFTLNRQSATQALSEMQQYFTETSITKECAEGLNKLQKQWQCEDFEGIEWYFHWFNLDSVSLLEYVPQATTILWNDLFAHHHRFNEYRSNYERHRERAPSIFLPLLTPPDQLLFSDDYIDDLFSCFKRLFIDTCDLSPTTPFLQFTLSEQPFLPKNIDAIIATIDKYTESGYTCILACPNKGHAERMIELLGDKASELLIYTGFLSKGYIDTDKRCVLFTESQFVNSPKPTATRKKRTSALPITGYDALTPDDYIVHEDHGIARFLGIEHISAGDINQDCMVLLYAGGTKIYVPISDFYKVQKYIGKDSAQPVLSKIGTASWEKLKAKTKESIQAMAQELIDLYAKRQYFEGISCKPDTIWQREFEDAFIYEETDDQLNAVRDIKKDMESSKPMDRLVCGDVGFGKTEVAIRAAFKAVMSGYQVAVLAPTTILASQHFTTFSERMRDFPVRIGVLSRFVKQPDVKKWLSQIKDGTVDIIIGTHRVLSQDVQFKNLGLLIIDEEQRFGVQHKEKISQFKFIVDILSLSATPIPRTLQLSLIGARDLSIINTPPRNRLPIETKVLPYHEEYLKSAIENELDRGGQVYFVNNRISSLEAIKDTIELCVPRARVIIAHGQMNEDLLENIMKEFIAGRFDVLLSTVIIENGLDIPNVNTIIVNRADTLGLSQLYQLRGRVGRSSEQAYSLFFTPPFKELSDVSLKRLKALEQYTELGSGFQIAMRDLEIRGAGNILGTRQHGFIEAIGFELYCRILQDAINELKDPGYTPKNIDVKIEIPLQAYIPKEFVNDGPNRVALYQELSSLTEYTLVGEFEKTVLDRFGPFPEPVVNLLNLVKIKTLLISLSISHLLLSSNKKVILTFHGNDNDAIRKTIALFISLKEYSCEVDSDKAVKLSIPLFSNTITEQTTEILRLLNSIILM